MKLPENDPAYEIGFGAGPSGAISSQPPDARQDARDKISAFAKKGYDLSARYLDHYLDGAGTA